MKIKAVLCVGFLIQALFAVELATPLYVYHDGDATTSGYSGSEKDLYIDGGSLPSIAWMTFQSQGLSLLDIDSARIILSVRSVGSAGTLSVHALTNDITAPENNVKLDMISYAPEAIAHAYVGSMSAEKCITFDITLLAKSGTFKGLVLLSDDGLVATFDAKEGVLPPRISLLYSSVSGGNGSQWLAGSELPDSLLGTKGDFYLQSTTGAIFSKGTGSWVVTANIMGPAGSLGPQGISGAPGIPGEKGEAGIQGQKGDAGIQGKKGNTGPQGAKGDTGLQGSRGDAGRSLIWRGTWSADSGYAPYDLVHHDGSAYIGVASSQGKSPSDSLAYWNVFVRKGDMGLSGPQGSSGPSGTAGMPGPVGPQGPKGDSANPLVPLPAPSTYHVVSAATGMIPNNSYIANSASQVSVGLPDSAAVGDFVKIRAQGTGGFSVTQNATQYINASILNKPVSFQSQTTLVNPWDIDGSSDGKYLTAIEWFGDVYTSTDTGNTWTHGNPATTSTTWGGVATSADGKEVFVCEMGGLIWRSTDFGQSWKSYGTPQSWVNIQVSDDGETVVAITDGDFLATIPGNEIWVSTDSGITFNSVKTVPDLQKIAISGDGARIAAVSQAGKIAISSNRGATWIESDSARGWVSIALSHDGKYVYAGTNGGFLYVSSDSGVTFSSKAEAGIWRDIACSSDGKTVYAIEVEQTHVYYSLDFGQTFAQRVFENNDQWWALTLSSDGSKIAAVNINAGNVFTSTFKTTLGPTGALYSTQPGSTVELVKLDDQQYLLTNVTGVVDGK